MSIIETEIWESHPERKGCVCYVGQRKAEDVFNDLTEYLKKEKIYPDEYFLLNRHFEGGAVIPRVEDVICYAQWGGSEGIYLEVEFVIRNESGDSSVRVNFATGKTLGETGEDFDRMQYIAGCIYKAFTNEGQNYRNIPVYLLEESWAIDGKVINETDLFADYNAAKLRMEQRIKAENESGLLKTWKANAKYQEDCLGDSFEAWIDGFYTSDHFCLCIQKKFLHLPIEKKCVNYGMEE